MDDKPQKPHRKAHAGRKADKKSSNTKNAEKNNPKAFAVQSGRRLEKMARRKEELTQKKLHVPLIDRTPTEPPPVVIAVVGPPNSGKSTLIKSLVKRYTRQNLNEINGPVTVVSGRKRRLTFIECSNDLNAMIDVAKIADLVLLMIDAAFGFEMETFEFLNILQTHGFPKIMGVLTHLDKFNNNKQLRVRKKSLKQRFWTEIYPGAKLFYLSGVLNGTYPKTEILNLSRFISVMKFRPLVWRNAHPYLIADRIEDLTLPQEIESNPKCDRKVALLGYLRGTYIKDLAKVHIPGVGDHTISHVSEIPDPCPLPDSKRKSLNDKHKLIYAPMSDVGGVMYDKDAIYIQVPGHFTNRDQTIDNLGEGEKMMVNLQNYQGTIDQQLKQSTIQLFSSSQHLDGNTVNNFKLDESDSDNSDEQSDSIDDDDDDISAEDHHTDISDDDDKDVDGNETLFASYSRSHGRRRAMQTMEALGSCADERIEYAEDDVISLSEDDLEESKWKSKMVERTIQQFRESRRINLMDLVYGDTGSSKLLEHPQEAVRGSEDFLFMAKKDATHLGPLEDAVRKCPLDMDLDHWENAVTLDSISHLFITGDTPKDHDLNTHEDDVQPGDDLDGEFDDLEDCDSDQPLNNKEIGADELARPPQNKVDEMDGKRAEMKKKFDAEYDGLSDDENHKELSYFDVMKEQMQKQLDLTRTEFGENDAARVRVLGHAPGTYVRLIIDRMPCELIDHFDPKYPIVVGGIGPGEDQYSYMQVRFKKHRWYKRILKNNDPLIISLGWRRFQTLPLFSLDDRIRNKMLKYTPMHMHCLATFYGPTSVPNTGFCAFQSVEGNTPDFRVAATGTILDINQSSEVVKKLKLTGEPSKIYKNTAFIKNMFTSALEVAKFEGAAIKTVSGIRGQIKKAIQPEGSFRATFEDKIMMSDIVFLKAWYPVKPKKYCNPVTSLLLNEKTRWRGMRLANTVRHEVGISIPTKHDSTYREITERPKVQVFATLKIPKTLQKELPFKSKPKQIPAQKRPGLLKRRAIVAEPHERKVNFLLAQIRTLKKARDEKQKAKAVESLARRNQARNIEMAKRTSMLKDQTREYFRVQGKKRPATTHHGGRSAKRPNRNEDD